MNGKPFRHDRRQFLRASGAFGLAGATPLLLTSCLGDGTDERPTAAAAETRENRTLHFDLSLAGVVDPRLHVLRSVHHRAPLVEHTADSRARARATLTALAAVDDARLTHYVEAVDLPAEALQTVSVMGKDAAGGPVLVGLYMSVPPKVQAVVDRRAAGAGRTSPSVKALAYGVRAAAVDDAPGDGLNDYLTRSDTAAALVFHRPDIMNLQPDLGADILARIKQSPCTPGGDPSCLAYLEQLIYELGQVPLATPKAGGWAQLFATADADGNPVLDETGQPLYRWEPSDRIADSTGAVAKQILQQIFDDPLFEGTNWHAATGVARVVAPERTVLATALDTAFDVVSDPPLDSWFEGMHVVGLQVIDAASRKVELTLKNAYLRYLSVYVKFFDSQDAAVRLSDTVDGDLDDYTRFVGLALSNVNYMGIPFVGNDVPDTKLVFTMPPGASRAEVRLGSLGARGGDAFGAEAVLGSCLTLGFNIALPTMALALGVFANFSVGLNKMLANPDLLATLSTAFKVLLGKTVPRIGVSIFNSAEAQSPKPFFVALGGVVVGALLTALPALAQQLAGTATFAAIKEAIPFVNIICRGLATAADLAQILETVGEVCTSKAVSECSVRLKMSTTVSIERAEGEFEFPAAATHWTVEAVYDGGGTPQHACGTLVSGRAEPILAVLPAVPSGGFVVVKTMLYSATGCLVGYAKSGVIVNLPATAGTIGLQITEVLAALNAQTQYRHLQILGYAAGRRAWTPGPAPTATLTSLCAAADGAVCGLDGITVHTPTGMAGYGYYAGGQNVLQCGSSTNGGGALHLVQNEFLGDDPDRALKLSACGTTEPIGIVYDAHGPATGGRHFFLQQAPANAASDGFFLRAVDLAATVPLDLAQTLNWGRFNVAQDSLAVVPSGYVVGVNRRNHKMEIVKLGKTAKADADATRSDNFSQIVSGYGTRPGLMNTPVAVATARGAILVLEQGNGRIQAFTPSGAPTPLFANATTNLVTFKPEANTVFLDLAAEEAGYMYVLLYTGDGTGVPDYHLDIYAPDGAFVSRTSGVACARIAVDLFRVLYTLNYQTMAGSPRIEPSLSKWLPSDDASCQRAPPGSDPASAPVCSAT